MARRRPDVSNSGSKPASRRFSTLLMSAEEIRDVSSSMASIPAGDWIRSDSPRGRPCLRTRVVTSSSRYRRIPASSLVALK